MTVLAGNAAAGDAPEEVVVNPGRAYLFSGAVFGSVVNAGTATHLSVESTEAKAANIRGYITDSSGDVLAAGEIAEIVVGKNSIALSPALDLIVGSDNVRWGFHSDSYFTAQKDPSRGNYYLNYASDSYSDGLTDPVVTTSAHNIGYVVAYLEDQSEPVSPLTGRVNSSTSVTATLPVSGTDGTVFAVAVPPTGSATAPTGPQIEAGTDGADVAVIGGSTPVTAAGDIPVELTGLTANTEYTIHVVHKAADGTYGSVVSTTITPNPVLSGTLETSADTPYVAGGNWTVAVLNADMTGITTATVTPDADGTFRIVDALLPVSTEVVIASIAPDGTNGVIGKLTTSA